MPYMIYQQYITAVKENYTGRDNLLELHAEAKRYRTWLEGLNIDQKLKDSLVEPVAAIEGAFLDLAGNQ